MNADEIDKIIAESVAKSKGKSRWHRPQRRTRDLTAVRTLLNMLFLIGFVAAVIIYFAMPEQRTLFFSLGFGALLLKIIEYIIRFFA